MKKTVAVVLAIVFVLAFAVPVFAQNMTHNAVYKMDGSIDLEKQVGHLCNTGLEAKQTITGEGVMDKVMDVAMEQYVATVSDHMDWVTAEDAVRNLTVTSVIELCAPPKYTLDTAEYVYGENVGWQQAWSENRVPTAMELYESGIRDWDLRSWAVGAHWEDTELLAEILAMTDQELLAAFGGHPVADPRYGTGEFSAVSPQIWAVQVEADAGYSGNLHQDFEAAYGPYGGVIGDPEGSVPGNVDGRAGDDFFFFQPNAAGAWGVTAGDDYVGNYFNIDQLARTSQGTVRRYIDISSPWSHAYLYEDMVVVGMAEIEESFAMNNLTPGVEATPEWWDLF